MLGDGDRTHHRPSTQRIEPEHFNVEVAALLVNSSHPEVALRLSPERPSFAVFTDLVVNTACLPRA